MYLVDTNVISEARKGSRANAGIIQFFRSTQASECYLSVQTVGEIQRGIDNIRRRGDVQQALRLDSWLEAILIEYAHRILIFDSDCARIWGRLMSPQASHPIDKQIAAIALIHGLDVVTRNVDDFKATGVNLMNPFA